MTMVKLHKSSLATGVIAGAITKKVAIILASAHFVSVLTHGSQTRKTGSDKEMVLVRTQRNGNS